MRAVLGGAVLFEVVPTQGLDGEASRVVRRDDGEVDKDQDQGDTVE